MDVPRATYRLQLGPGFGFAQVEQLAPYLAALGVSHVYCSPCLEAVPGSEHGYDVTDFHAAREELGGERGFRSLCAALRAHGLGPVLDIVPNHMAAHPCNAWWQDRLEHGGHSVHAQSFDIDLAPGSDKRLLLPILGDHVGRVLEARGLAIERRGAQLRIRHGEHALPVSVAGALQVLERTARLPDGDALAPHVEQLARAGACTDLRARSQRALQVRAAYRQLEKALDADPRAAAALDAAIAQINDDPHALLRVLDVQHYRLAYWRLAAEQLNYRRFFDIDHLIALRQEDPETFEATHARVLEWVREGLVQGLRIDHVDGLRDPEAYLRQLRKQAPGVWICVEKILCGDEELPASWPVQGTTGYEFIGHVDRVLMDPEGARALRETYSRFTGRTGSFRELLLEKKRAVCESVLGSDLERLERAVALVCGADPAHRDHTHAELRDALREWIAELRVYRTYVREGARPRPEDTRENARVARALRERRPDLDPRLIDLIEELFLQRRQGQRAREAVEHLQQLSGPAMAKGGEDTALYSHVPLLALCEVGGDPDREAESPEEFHAYCARIAALQPATLLAGSTHDTKRSEDVRARLIALAAVPEEWAAALQRWSALGAAHWKGAEPDRNTEVLLFQTLIGAWPIETERVQEALRKSVREAKERTSWARPDPVYEEQLANFIAGLLADAEFRRDLESLVGRLLQPAQQISLAALLLRGTAPGVPDFYQGSELWYHALVDPDNRRPVDFAERARLLQEAVRCTPRQALERADTGLPKLFLIRRMLEVRQRHSRCFAPGGAYAPLPVQGPRAQHVLAFARGDAAITAVPRLLGRLEGPWADTRIALPPGHWESALGAGPAWTAHALASELFAQFPVALLVRRDAEPH